MEPIIKDAFSMVDSFHDTISFSMPLVVDIPREQEIPSLVVIKNVLGSIHLAKVPDVDQSSIVAEGLPEKKYDAAWVVKFDSGVNIIFNSEGKEEGFYLDPKEEDVPNEQI